MKIAQVIQFPKPELKSRPFGSVIARNGRR
jgi:hypothetical protein